MAQLVGRNCVHCGDRISSELGARFCPDCGSPVHHRCARPGDGAGCSVCGAPTRPPAEPRAVGGADPGPFREAPAGAEADPGGCRPHRGGVILALGVLSLVLCPLIGFIPLLMAGADLRAMRDGTMDRSGHGITQAGYILGAVAAVMSAFTVVIMCLFTVSAGGG